ncbi:hypothetical protein [Noviherbaspirillum humi]|nr:hypothetical protein [Noviherbaspirillum humi]
MEIDEEGRLVRRNYKWVARVVRHEEEDGWCVHLTKNGADEPSLVVRWETEKDRSTPKQLDEASFTALVRAADGLERRHRERIEAARRKSVIVDGDEGEVDVQLLVIPDDDDPHAVLTACGRGGERLASEIVPADFRMTRDNAARWVRSGFRVQVWTAE